MQKITITNSFHNTEASFIPQPTDNPGVFTVSRSVSNRVSRDLCGSPDCCCGSEIESHGGENWDVVNVAYDRSVLIRFHKFTN